MGVKRTFKYSFFSSDVQPHQAFKLCQNSCADTSCESESTDCGKDESSTRKQTSFVCRCRTFENKCFFQNKFGKSQKNS